MPKITRVTAIPFGVDGTTDDFETFGSTAAGATDYSKDIAAIQATDDWKQGWRPALITAKAPVLQDMNGKMLVDSNLICYLFQEGVPEYDTATTYWKGGVVKNLANSGYIEFYASLVDTNLGNALPTRVSNGNWMFLYAISTTAQGLIIPGTITNDSAAAGDVGEIIVGSTVFASALSLSVGVAKTIASVSLSAGDWDVWINAAVIATHVSTTFTELIAAISLTTNAIPGSAAIAVQNASGEIASDNSGLSVAPGNGNPTMCVPVQGRIKLASPATVYMVILAQFTNTATGFGSISARRRR